MRIIINPSVAPGAQIDITNAMIAAVAQEIARLHDGNELVNWIEAEKIVMDLVSGPRRNTQVEVRPLSRQAQAI